MNQALKPANIQDINPGDIVTVLAWKSGNDRSWIGDKLTVKEVKPPFIRVRSPWAHGSEYSLDTRLMEVALWDAKPGPWRAAFGQFYWMVFANGSVQTQQENDQRLDDNAYRVGNYYRTAELAEAVAVKIRALHKDADHG
jgi:hypothetical protein